MSLASVSCLPFNRSFLPPCLSVLDGVICENFRCHSVYDRLCYVVLQSSSPKFIQTKIIEIICLCRILSTYSFTDFIIHRCTQTRGHLYVVHDDACGVVARSLHCTI